MPNIHRRVRRVRQGLKDPQAPIGVNGGRKKIVGALLGSGLDL